MSEIFFSKSKTSISKEELEKLKKVGDEVYENMKKSYSDTNYRLPKVPKEVLKRLPNGLMKKLLVEPEVGDSFDLTNDNPNSWTSIMTGKVNKNDFKFAPRMIGDKIVSIDIIKDK